MARWASSRSMPNHPSDPPGLRLDSTASARPHLGRLPSGGPAGNGRLTAAAGVLLVALLAPLGVTILRIKPLLGPHMFIGLLLIPPVLLKMASTGYRFVRYYTYSPSYRRKGPPAP